MSDEEFRAAAQQLIATIQENIEASEELASSLTGAGEGLSQLNPKTAKPEHFRALAKGFEQMRDAFIRQIEAHVAMDRQIIRVLTVLTEVPDEDSPTDPP